MELLLLGTAAAEGWPCPFCDCPACMEARRRGGRDLRTRPGALLDGVVKIDYGPDTLVQMQREGRDLLRLTTLVFTHAHADHFSPVELQYRGPGFIPHTALPLLHVFGNPEVMGKLAGAFPTPDRQRLELHEPLEPLRAVTAPDGTEILPLPADHAPGALLLRLTRGGRRLLYGHDSGLYPPETVTALAGVPLDIALFDCTHGGEVGHTNRNHLAIDGVVEMIDRLRGVGAVTDATRLIATHFSHNGGLLYDELSERFAPHSVRVAYDGLSVKV